MNFGDILDKWEKQHSGGGSRAANESGVTAAGTDPQNPVNPIDAWLRVNGVYDKDTSETGPHQSAAQRRQRLRRKKPDAEIDIHGLTRDEAEQTLLRFFCEAKDRGHEKVLIIHGKGNHCAGEPVLKRLVREFIEHCPVAGESGQGKAAAGGEGATWVLLKPEAPSEAPVYSIENQSALPNVPGK
ncbi:MAG: Smr/MutS family protein [Treponema sp.]|jgi:DNA-nicking Smr family endonuclease|nr:Smr/MutS family protein [Treponema sp.]